MYKEARISINGTTLLYGQSMALRVAVTSFIMDLREDGLGDDEHGKKLAALYLNNLEDVLSLITKSE